MKNIHFISGLPRSGSTLLSAILSQNPEFHASISSPLAHIFNAAWQAMGKQNEGVPFLDNEMRETILDHIVRSYYWPFIKERGTQTTIFDTSRVWTAKTHLILSLFPEAKMICCVRNVAWVIDSLERLHRRNSLSPIGLFRADQALNVFDRVNALAAGNGMVGNSYNNLREACFGDYRDRICLVRYESLVENTVGTIIELYEFIGINNPLQNITEWKHDFDNIKFPQDEARKIADFDARLNAPGLHSVRPKVEAFHRETVLPPEIFQNHAESDFWNRPEFARTGIKVI